MSDKKTNLSQYSVSPSEENREMIIGIVASQWNEQIMSQLLKGCKQTLLEEGIEEENIEVVHVPGSFELPTGARMLDDKINADAIICLGCVIKGETAHNEYINQSVSQGLMQLGIMRSKPFVFGVLTPNDMAQAEDRAGGKHGNKGVEAAVTALKMAALRRNLQLPKKTIGFS